MDCAQPQLICLACCDQRPNERRDLPNQTTRDQQRRHKRRVERGERHTTYYAGSSDECVGYERCECAECGVVDCSGVGWWFDNYGVYRHGESGGTVVLVDDWSSVMHGDGFDEWYELHVYRDSNECGGDE